MAKRFEKLQDQIATTLKNLERGEIRREDRVFLYHILDELDHIVDFAEQGIDNMDSLNELIGSTNELVEDGLGDA